MTDPTGPALEGDQLERTVLDAIDVDQLLDDLRTLVGIPSVDGTPAELEVQRWCAERLRALGLAVDAWDEDVAALQGRDGFPGMEVDRTGLVGCVGVLGPTDETPALALYGHTDVVPPGDLDLWPDRDPFLLRSDDASVWGRGACDMKGGVASILAAVSAVRRAAPALPRPLAVHLVSAEEDGGLGAFATLLRGHRAEACVSAEPTGGDMIPANAGSLTFRIEVQGLSTHGSTRGRGVSAIDKFERVHAALRVLEARRNADAPPWFDHLDLPWPLSVGIISAGDWASTVPDRLVAEGRYGVRVDETIDDARKAFEDTVAETCAADPWLRDHPVRVGWSGGQFTPGRLPAGHGLLDAVGGAVADVTGRAPEAFGGPYGSDLRHYTAAGVPTLQYGPGDVRFAHATDEHVPVDELVTCAKLYALLILRACGQRTAQTTS